MSLNGKVALVTGAAKRIGRVLAHTLAEAGADVAITYRESRRGGRANAAGIRIDRAAVDGAALRCAGPCVSAGMRWRRWSNEFGRLDLLVNNAGVFATAPLESITVEQWDEMFETNTRGAFLMAQAAHPHLKGSSRPHHQHWFAGRHASLADARALLHLEGGAAYADADNVESICAGDQRELRCARNDHERRSASGL